MNGGIIGTILKVDTLRIIQANFGWNWRSGLKDDLKKKVYKVRQWKPCDDDRPHDPLDEVS